MEASSNMRDRRSLTLSTSTSGFGDAVYTEEPVLQSEKQIPHLLLGPPAHASKEKTSKQRQRSSTHLAVQIFVSLCGIAALWRIVFRHSFNTSDLHISSHQALHAPLSSSVPEIPSIVTFSDNHGHSLWTVGIPRNYTFPLQDGHAQEICKRGSALREDPGRQSRLTRAKERLRKSTYYTPDESFVQIEEAERLGLLPSSDQEDTGNVCDRTLTFVLDAEDDSIGKSLLLMWLSYGLAMKEGRAFFIDDSRWVYGQYASYFAPPPAPQCAMPSPQRIVPCPHNAQHLMVSTATSHWMFDASFEEEFLHARKHGTDRSRRIFDLLRRGYDDLFHLTGELELYSSSRIAKFKDESELIAGIHIRRGNLHPYEAQFSQDYIPPERYGVAAHDLLQSLQRYAQNNTDDFEPAVENVDMPLLLATDDPEMFNSVELGQSVSPYTIQKAQERFQLTTKSDLDLASPTEPIREPDSIYIKFFDENSGFEGGFYPCSQAAQQMRETIARAYLLDLAVLSSSDGIVCGIASSTCRILGVMLGWTALEEGRFVNIDDGRPWSWDGQQQL